MTDKTSPRTISAKYFSWHGMIGSLMMSDLPLPMGFNPFNGQPIIVHSEKSGRFIEFFVNENVPGWEDGWDGEAVHMISNEGFEIKIFND